ncbi:MAG: hypothetical protein HRU07_06780 [Nitrosopumilus sp.]|nr:hypothetical protein [Nitrosopumilus sp.]NRA05843.1 hypothetical protein [Nitrosopumilus sp.]
MVKDSKTWGAIRIRTALKNKIESIIKTDKNQYLGITNASQFTDLALREKLNQLEKKSK